MLERFLRIYTWSVSVLVVVLLLLGVYNLYWGAMPYRAYLCFFIAALAIFILFVTRSLGRKNMRRRP